MRIEFHGVSLAIILVFYLRFDRLHG